MGLASAARIRKVALRAPELAGQPIERRRHEVWPSAVGARVER